MKLYYAPGACSLAPNIILHEIGKPFTAEAVNLKDGAQFQPAYQRVNPKAKVPVLERDDGSILTELPAISIWLGRTNPAAGLLAGDDETLVRAIEWLNFLSGSLHNGGYTRITRAKRFVGDAAHVPAATEKAKADTIKHLVVANDQLAGRDYALGARYSVVDPYLFVLARWVGRTGKALADFPNLAALHDRVAARPAVQATLKAEGLS